MTKWEYGQIRLCTDVSANMAAFQERGEQGWELISVDQGIAYFRRPKTDIAVHVGPSKHKAPSSGPSV